MEKSLKDKNIFNSLLISFSFMFNLFIFGPVEFYLTNVYDFWFSIKSILPILLIVGIIIFFIIFCLLTFLKDKKRKIFVIVLLGLYLGLYIQGNFLNKGYGKMDGSIIEWDKMIQKGIINTIIWIVLFIPFVFIKPIKTNIKPVSNIIFGYVLLVQIVTIFVVYVGQSRMDLDKEFYLDNTNAFEMSSKENTIIYMADTIQSDYLIRAIDENEEFKEELKDFVRFDNATTCSLLTAMSFPSILTGENLQVGMNLKDSLDIAYEKTDLYDILEENNYDVEFYTDKIYAESGNINIKNKTKIEEDILDFKSKIKLYGSLMKCVYFKYSPHFLKPFLEVNTAEFNNIDTVDEEIKTYLVDDVKYYENLSNSNMISVDKNKCLKIIQMDGCHMPHTIDEYMQYDSSRSYLNISSDIRIKNEVNSVVRIFVDYIKKMKSAGVYDNSNIIFIADHGHTNRYNPSLMIKRKNETHSSIQINNAPVSTLEDFKATLENLITNSKDYGKDVYDYYEGQERVRRINDYIYSSEWNNYFVEANVVVMTKDNANEFDKYYIGDQIYIDNEYPKKYYNFNDKIGLLTDKNREYVSLSGIINGDWYVKKGSLLGKNAKIVIKPKKVDKDVNVQLKINNVLRDNQILRIILDNEELFERTYDETSNPFIIEFSIPKDLWNKNEFLELEIETPNCVSGENGSNWGQFPMFLSFSLDYIKFFK